MREHHRAKRAFEERLVGFRLEQAEHQPNINQQASRVSRLAFLFGQTPDNGLPAGRIGVVAFLNPQEERTDIYDS